MCYNSVWINALRLEAGKMVPRLKYIIVARRRQQQTELTVEPNGEVVAFVKQRYKKADQDALVFKNLAEIRRTQYAAAEAALPRELLWKYDEGSALCLGEERRIVCGEKPLFDGERFVLPDGLAENERIAALAAIYRRLAASELKARTERLAMAMDVCPSKVLISSAQRRWGSCNAKKELRFAWRLIMASPEAIDSVVVHELAHTLEMNHGKDFKKLVFAAMPDYSERHEELRRLAARLQFELWPD